MHFPNSLECAKSELDLFMIPSTQTSVQEGVWDTIYPHSNYQSGTIQFDIPSSHLYYLDLSATELHLTVTIRKTNDLDNTLSSPIQDKDEIGPVNNFIHSLFQQIQTYLNNTPVENSNSTYAYRAYLEVLLNHSKEAKETFLQSNLYIKDTAEQMENFNTCLIPTIYRIKSGSNPPELETIYGNEINLGYVLRRKRCVAKSVQLKSKIHSEIFNVNKYLVPNVNVTIKLTRSRESFCLCGTPGPYSVYIDNATLKVRRVTVSPAVMAAHELALQKATAKYPITRVVIKPITIPSLTNKTTLSGVHIGLIPKRVIIGFVETEAFHGSFRKNPFNFKHFNLTNLTLKVASRALPYSSGLEFNFSQERYIDGFNSLFEGIREASNDIDYYDYANGYTLFAFNLAPDLCTDDHFNVMLDGSLDLDLTFAEIPDKSITALFYLEFDDVVEIDKNRQVIFNYKV